MPICSLCKAEKEKSEFYPRTDRKSGVTSGCKVCSRKQKREYTEQNKDMLKIRKKAWCRDNKLLVAELSHRRYMSEIDKRRDKRLRKLYGIGWMDKLALLDVQNGRCAICGGTEHKGRVGWSLDHCHKTGKIRGILCGPCNVSIGLMKESPEILREAALYLERHVEGTCDVIKAWKLRLADEISDRSSV